MKRNVRNWWRAALLTVAMTALTMSCSVDDADSRPVMQSDANYSGSAIYDGEWTVNKQMVDTARLVVGADGGFDVVQAMRVRLPERYLLSTYIVPLYAQAYGYKVDDVRFELANQPVNIGMETLGYSEQSKYMSFGSAPMQDADDKYVFLSCSFTAAINGTSYHVSLLAKEKATAVMQYGTGQWTLAIPISGFLLADTTASTQAQLTLQLPVTFYLYYNTKTRIG